MAHASRKHVVESIIFLRFVASALIVLYHSELPLMRLSSGDYVPRLAAAAAGTDMLFVISGFVIVYMSHGKSVPFADFVLRRLLRIAPLYWFLTVLMLGLYLAYPNMFYTTVFDLEHFLASLAFLPYPHPVTGLDRPFLVPGWTLNYFVFFYVLFGLAMLLPTIRSEVRVAAVTITIIAIVTLRLLFPGVNSFLDFYGSPISTEFIFGMLVGLVSIRPRPIRSLCLIMATVIAISTLGSRGMAPGDHARVLYWGLIDTGLLCACLMIEIRWGWKRNALVQTLGQASYSTYLTNLFSVAFVATAVRGLDAFPVIGSVGAQIAMLVIALSVGVTVHVCLERPLDRWLKPGPANAAPSAVPP